MKVVFIQLADETRKIAVLEMFGQDGFGESFVLRGDVRISRDGGGGSCQFPLVPTSRTTKLSPSSPHLTTDE